MDEDMRLRAECEALKAGGASAEEVFRRMKAEGCKNWQSQVMLMGLFDMSLDEARRVSHRIRGVNQMSAEE